MTSITLALGGNCNTDFLKPHLEKFLSASNISTNITSLPYDNWMTSAFDEEQSFDFWIIWHSAMGATKGSTLTPHIDKDLLQQALQAIQKKGGTVLYILPEALLAEDNPFSPFATWRMQTQQTIRQSMPDTFAIMTIEHIQRQYGMSKWYDPRYWEMAKIPCHPDMLPSIAQNCVMSLTQLISPAIKAIIVDLDNTLWGGVIGDDGIDGIELDPYGTGRPFLEMQAFLKHCKNAGMPICVVSKNEPEQALLPFQTDDMLLKKEDILYFSASWDPKHMAILDIIKKINIDPKNVCFIDDSPFERGEAQNFIPSLIVPNLPEEPEERVPYLIKTGLFWTPVIRAEDQNRVATYMSDIKRQEIAEKASTQEEYLQNLEMTLTVCDITDENLSRVVSLIQKTNQFNLSNYRHLANDVIKLKNQDNCYAKCYKLSDRFTDYGIISVFISYQEQEHYTIDTWVLSCRVFSRGVEHAIFEHFKSHIPSNVTLHAHYHKTKKNNLVNTLLNLYSFEEGEQTYIAHETKKIPHFIKIIEQ